MGSYNDLLYCEVYPYVTPEEVLGCCSIAATQLDETDPRLIDAVEDASLLIYYLTGKQLPGTCEGTVRPCLPCLDCSCGCCEPNQVKLGYWPITSIVSVREEGVTITDPVEIAALYHIDEYRYLVRNDGEPFPVCNNMSALTDSDEDGLDDRFVFEVTVEYGMTVPGMVRRATRALACQLLRSCIDLECQLPTRVTQVVRQGVSYEMENVIDYLAQGRTGIFEVDLLVTTLNPSRLQSPSFIWSPDIDYGRRVNT